MPECAIGASYIQYMLDHVQDHPNCEEMRKFVYYFMRKLAGNMPKEQFDEWMNIILEVGKNGTNKTI